MFLFAALCGCAFLNTSCSQEDPEPEKTEMFKDFKGAAEKQYQEFWAKLLSFDTEVNDSTLAVMIVELKEKTSTHWQVNSQKVLQDWVSRKIENPDDPFRPSFFGQSEAGVNYWPELEAGYPEAFEEYAAGYVTSRQQALEQFHATCAGLISVDLDARIEADRNALAGGGD